MSIAPTETAAWHALRAHHESFAGVTLRDLFRDDPGRAARMTHAVEELRVDLSKHLATPETMRRAGDTCSTSRLTRSWGSTRR